MTEAAVVAPAPAGAPACASIVRAESPQHTRVAEIADVVVKPCGCAPAAASTATVEVDTVHTAVAAARVLDAPDAVAASSDVAVEAGAVDVEGRRSASHHKVVKKKATIKKHNILT